MSFYRSSMWSIIQMVATQVVALLTNIILARILTPEIFGLLGMATLFTGIILVIQEVGVGAYLIYKQDTEKTFVSTVFKVNIILSFLLAGILFSVSAPISDFYNSSEVEQIIKYISLGVVLGSFGITTRSVFQKEMKFKRIMVIDIISELLSSVIAVLLAVLGYSILSITTKLLFRPAIQSIGFLLQSNVLELVNQRFRVNMVREMISYSSKVLGSQLLIYISSVADYLVIGKTMGSKELGYYTMAFNWSFMARSLISNAIGKVVFSDFSRLQNNKEKLTKRYVGVLELLAFILFPICVGFFCISSDFIKLLYGDKWIESVSLLQILMFAGLISGLGTTTNALFRSVGRPDIELKLFSYAFIFIFVLMYTGSYFGLKGVCYAVIIENSIIFFIRSYFVMKILGMNMKSYFKCFISSGISSLGMCIVYYLIKILTIQVTIVQPISLIIDLFVLVMSYVLISLKINRKFTLGLLYKIKAVLLPVVNKRKVTTN
ncbi:lipopolysaccharide biosynthesis protein [Paenibacillus sp. ATY16]|uniref:lipopolysaccharide biosynthesis protein n=1 Tax=Paenibacillus sp. ATY16 TaxID=1759312 RepID=UPI00200EB2F5|nr:lipopolysaccharide biosynthesis protein [Paenibacillus sp. ATY16]MCK9861967.1 lipopolysaccharide biosynthesis protein [Paenibacillus sp. ATY16]